jgi:hypothetical protein
MKRYIDENGTYHIRYENLHEFFTLTDIKSPSPEMSSENKSNYSEMKGNKDWRYGDEKTMEKFHTVRFDSEKGKRMCQEEVKKTMSSKEYKDLIKQALTYRKRIKYEDHGFRLNVAKAISGEDRYFGVYKNANKPVVKIAINICGSACVNQKSFAKLAATAIPTIYALEQAGISTEVWYTSFSSGTHTSSNIKHTLTEVLLKSAQQRFNWTTFAPVFCLGSYRESIFLSWLYSSHKTSCGLGRPMTDSDIKQGNNYGYSSVIGFNAVGPVSEVSTIFDKIKLKTN